MDTILINIIFCLAGLTGLYFGGEKLVTGAVTMANKLNIRPQLVAITIVALGTSLPELFVSVNAVNQGAQGIAWGNVIGSNISNLFCVLGFAAIISPLLISSRSLKVEVFWLFFSCGVLVLSARMFSSISILGGALLLILLLGIIFHVSITALKNQKSKIEDDIDDSWKNSKIWISLLTICFGVLLLIGSAELVVFSAKKIAEILVIPEAFIGLTIIALGTSLPEVAASIVAVKRGHSDIALGNVIGSNIFNSLGIIGAAAIASGSQKFVAPENFVRFDILVMLASTLILGVIFLYAKRIGRHVGAIFVCTYLVYVWIAFHQTQI